jgi:hypothetical protein
VSTGEESVVEALRTALAQSGASAVRVHLAQALLAAGQATEAFDACREILAGEPGHLDALALAGHAARDDRQPWPLDPELRVET